MYGKAKGNNVPSDAQARERLALYVYEYLLHVGAHKAAQTFLSEIRWEKSITLGDPPGFLHSWWCVFWDLYCAAPERRDTHEHSSEAKAFHDYSSATAPSPLNPMGADGINTPGMPPNFFPPGSAASPSPHHNPSNPMIRQSFMSSRYPPGGPRGMQGPGPHQPMLQGMDRQSQLMNMHRMSHPRGLPGPMNPGWNPSSDPSYQSMPPYGQLHRIPNNSMSGPGMPLSLPGRQWPNPTGSTGPPVGQPGTPIMHPSPQGPPSRLPMHGAGPGTPHPHPQNFHNTKQRDSMNPDYGPIPGGKPGGLAHGGPIPTQFPMGSGGPEGVPTSMPMSGPGNPGSNLPVMNGLNGSGPDQNIDGLPKSSPSSLTPMGNPGGGGPIGPPHSGGPGTNPHTPQEGEGDSYNMPFPDNNQQDAAAILKMKESLQQEAKRFENKDGFIP
ncbi:single-stranded DNA-binding protein 3-like isoform X2 [Styela clava]